MSNKYSKLLIRKKCEQTNIGTDAKMLEGISKYTTTIVLRAIVNNSSYTKLVKILLKTSRQLRPVILLKFIHVCSNLHMYVGK